MSKAQEKPVIPMRLLQKTWLISQNIDYSAAIKGGHTNDSIIKSLSVNKNKEAGANAPGAVRGLISVLQGPTLGFADEILGGVGGAYDALTKGGGYLPNYRANRDYLRGAAEYQQKQNPWTTGITQTMASAPLSVLRSIWCCTASCKRNVSPVCKYAWSRNDCGWNWGAFRNRWWGWCIYC
jgi:hypothetical protein